MIPNVIKTKRLLLQEMHLGHRDLLEKVFKHPDFFYAHALQNNIPFDKAALKYAQLGENTRSANPRVSWFMSIFTNSSFEFIGAVVLVNVHTNEKYGLSAEIGYFIDVPFQRNGYASEAVHAIKEAGIHFLNLKCLWATVDPDNIASRNILESIGLSFESHHSASKYFKRDGSIAQRLFYRWTAK